MDITYKTENEKFNYRVCAVIISNGEILAMHDERSPYFYRTVYHTQNHPPSVA